MRRRLLTRGRAALVLALTAMSAVLVVAAGAANAEPAITIASSNDPYGITKDQPCPDGTVCVYRGDDFTGGQDGFVYKYYDAIAFPVSRCYGLTLSSFAGWGFNDVISSIKNLSKCTISFYTDDKFRGHVLNVKPGESIAKLSTTTRTDPTSVAFPFNDAISSMMSYNAVTPLCPPMSICVAVHPDGLTDAAHQDDPSLYRVIPATALEWEGGRYLWRDLRNVKRPQASTNTWNDSIGSMAVGTGLVQVVAFEDVRSASVPWAAWLDQSKDAELVVRVTPDERWVNLAQVPLCGFSRKNLVCFRNQQFNYAYRASSLVAIPTGGIQI